MTPYLGMDFIYIKATEALQADFKFYHEVPRKS